MDSKRPPRAGAKPIPALATVALGCLLYVGLPAIAPTPGPAQFRGSGPSA